MENVRPTEASLCLEVQFCFIPITLVSVLIISLKPYYKLDAIKHESCHKVLLITMATLLTDNLFNECIKIVATHLLLVRFTGFYINVIFRTTILILLLTSPLSLGRQKVYKF